MPKYYIDSGDLRFVVDSISEVEAIESALSICPTGLQLGRIIRANEQGFGDWEHETDMLFATASLLDELGIDFH